MEGPGATGLPVSAREMDVAVLMVSEWQGTPEQYDTCTNNLVDRVGLNQRCSFHALTLIGEGRCGITEVWG